MKLKLRETTTPLSRGFIIAFFLLLFLLTQAHQLMHHAIGGILCGQVGYLTFDRHYYAEELSPPSIVVATISGPLVNYIVMWIGMLLLLRSGRYSLLGFSLIFASIPFARVLSSQIGDEWSFGLWISQLFGLDDKYTPFISLFIVLLIIIPPLIIAYNSIGNKRKLLVFFAFLFLPVVLYSILILFPDHAFLVPAVKETVYTGTPPTPLVSLFWGIPLILIIAIISSTLLFFGKYVQYILPTHADLKD